MNPSIRIMILLGILVVIVLLLQFLSPVLMPFIVGASIAYFLDPLVDWLEEKGLGRSAAVILLFAVCAILMTIALLLLVPLIGHQLSLLSAKLPLAVEWFQQSFLPMLEAKTGYAIEIDTEQLKQKLQQDWSQVGSVVTTVLAQVSASSLVFLAVLGNLVLIPVVAFYILQDWDDIMEKIGTLLPRDVEPVVIGLASQVNEVLSAFVRGQLVVMFSLGAVYSLGLWIIGVDMALVLGMIAGLASIVPYMGFAVGLVASFVAAWFQFQDPMMLAWVLAVFSVGQALEGMVLTPMLVGDKIGLHPVAVIFAVMAGGQLFGFVGMLVALPVAAVIMVLLRYLHEYYLGSGLYNPGDGEPPLPAVAESVTESAAPDSLDVDAGLLDTTLEADDEV